VKAVIPILPITRIKQQKLWQFGK